MILYCNLVVLLLIISSPLTSQQGYCEPSTTCTVENFSCSKESCSTTYYTCTSGTYTLQTCPTGQVFTDTSCTSSSLPQNVKCTVSSDAQILGKSVSYTTDQIIMTK